MWSLHGGQGENLVPPHTRESVSHYLSLTCEALCMWTAAQVPTPFWLGLVAVIGLAEAGGHRGVNQGSIYLVVKGSCQNFGVVNQGVMKKS